MKLKTIFLGCIDIAGQLGDLERGYKTAGYNVFTFVWLSNIHYTEHKYSFVLLGLYPNFLLTNNCKFFLIIRKLFTAIIVIPFELFFWIWAILKYDNFHFMWFIPKYNKAVFWLIKLLGKKLIISFVGSDIKWQPLWIQEFDLRGLDHVDAEIRMLNTITQKATLNAKLRYVRVCEKYADVIYSGPEQAQLQLRPYFNFYLPVDIKTITFTKRVNKIPLVCIGTTEIIAKGSNILISNLMNFQKNSSIPFELFTIKNMSHTDVIKILERSDIFIYTPYGCGTGKFGMEAIAAGAVTLTGYDKDWLKFPTDSPVVHVQEATLIDKLEYYLNNPHERSILSEKGRKWAEKYADINWICEEIINNLNKPDEYDYFPEFFSNHATFITKWDHPNSVSISNKWTKYVSSCVWYKNFVKQRKRDGLEF